jgi:hypothetical protein
MRRGGRSHVAQSPAAVRGGWAELLLGAQSSHSELCLEIFERLTPTHVVIRA